VAHTHTNVGSLLVLLSLPCWLGYLLQLSIDRKYTQRAAPTKQLQYGKARTTAGGCCTLLLSPEFERSLHVSSSYICTALTPLWTDTSLSRCPPGSVLSHDPPLGTLCLSTTSSFFFAWRIKKFIFSSSQKAVCVCVCVCGRKEGWSSSTTAVHLPSTLVWRAPQEIDHDGSNGSYWKIKPGLLLRTAAFQSADTNPCRHDKKIVCSVRTSFWLPAQWACPARMHAGMKKMVEPFVEKCISWYYAYRHPHEIKVRFTIGAEGVLLIVFSGAVLHDLTGVWAPCA